MSCEAYKQEIYTWRPESDPAEFGALFAHMEQCTECTRLFEQLAAADRAIHNTIRQAAPRASLEQQILAGLAHQRGQAEPRRGLRSYWWLLPAVAALVLAVFWGVGPQVRRLQLEREVTALLSAPPHLQVNSTDRQQLLAWSAEQLQSPPTLPSTLDRVEFRGAALVQVGDHKGVFLKMKNEHRAGLLVIDARLTGKQGFQSLHGQNGCASLWFDGKRTYILLFQGSDREMQAYMEQMGIVS